jgi:hypothetical protein
MSLLGSCNSGPAATVVKCHPEALLAYRDVLNPRTDFDQLERLLGGQLNAEETASLKDFKLYILKGEAAWVLDQVVLALLYPCSRMGLHNTAELK